MLAGVAGAVVGLGAFIGGAVFALRNTSGEVGAIVGALLVGVIFGGAPESNGRIVYAVPAARLAAFLAER